MLLADRQHFRSLQLLGYLVRRLVIIIIIINKIIIIIIIINNHHTDLIAKHMKLRHSCKAYTDISPTYSYASSYYSYVMQ